MRTIGTGKLLVWGPAPTATSWYVIVLPRGIPRTTASTRVQKGVSHILIHQPYHNGVLKAVHHAKDDALTMVWMNPDPESDTGEALVPIPRRG